MKKHILTLLVVFIFGLITFSQTKEGDINIESSPKIEALIAKKVKYNKSNPKIKGYRIQLFSGSETGARNTRNKYLALFPNSSTSIDWDSPQWKVRVGKYLTRLEVDRAYEEIKIAFNFAVIVENLEFRL